MSDFHSCTRSPAEDRRTLLSALEALSDGVAIFDRETGTIIANEAYRRALGPLTSAESSGHDRPAVEMLDPHGATLSLDQWPSARALKGEFVKRLELTVRRLDTGAELVAEFSSASLPAERGGDHSIVVSFHDMTERRKHSAEIGRLTRLYATLSEVNQIIVRCSSRTELFNEICRVGVEYGKFGAAAIAWKSFASSSFVTVAARMQTTGNPIPDWSGFCGPCLEAVTSGQPVLCSDARVDACAAGCHAALADLGFRSCGSYPLYLNGAACGALTLCSRDPGFFNSPEDRLLREIAGDISFALDKLDRDAERQRMAALLAEGGRLAKIGNWERNFATGAAIWSQEMYRIYDRDPALGPVPFGELPGHYSDESWSRLNTAVNEALVNGTAYVCDAQMIRPGSEPLWSICRGEPLVDEEGRRVGIRGTIQDITALKRQIESTDLFRALIEHSSDGIYVADSSTGEILDANASGCAGLGYSRAELLALKAFDVVQGLTVEYYEAIKAKLRAEGHASIEFPHLRKDGTTFLGEAHLSLVTLARDYLLVIVRDVTAHRLAEQNLRTRTTFLEAMVESSRDAVLVVDEHMRVLLKNGHFVRMFHVPAELADTTDDALLLRHVAAQSKDPAAFVARVAELFGRLSDVSKEEIELADGRILDRYSAPVVDAPGQYFGRIWSFRDITEGRKLENQALRSQRLEAIGTLSNGIAHDLNNILTPMLMAAGLLATEARGPREADLLQLIENEGMRGAKIIQQLLTFSRGLPGKRALVQVRPLIQDLLNLIRETFPRSIVLKEKAALGLGAILGDVTQLHQVLLNLCVNARDAMPNGGNLTVRAENAAVTPELAALQPEAKVGAYVLITVEDDGEGIPAEIVDRIFDPFFTTKGPGKGSGLGLSTALGIVKSHGGLLVVDSTPGKGSLFQVYLPCAVGYAAAATVPQPAVRRGTGELILVVDDEPSILITTTAALTRQGYRVVSAPNGLAGKTVFDARRSEIRLAVIDQMMPVMNGEALIAAIRAEGATTPIIAVTGMSQVDQPARLQTLGIAEVILKPYSPDQLIEAIDRILYPAIA